jgi:hypothetical protein
MRRHGHLHSSTTNRTSFVVVAAINAALALVAAVLALVDDESDEVVADGSVAGCDDCLLQKEGAFQADVADESTLGHIASVVAGGVLKQGYPEPNCEVVRVDAGWMWDWDGHC